MNISMLDAPVSGGVKGAELGTLTFIVGEELILKKQSLSKLWEIKSFRP